MNLHKFSPKAKDWFSVRAAANGEPAEVFIYDEIGSSCWSEGVTPSRLIDEIKSLKLKSADTLSVRINSPGGSVFDGNTIYNYLRSIKQRVEVTIDGLAASAASVIAMAGDTVRMPENSFLMIHNPWMMAMGDAQVMRKVADDLDEIREGAIKTYLTRTNGKVSRADLTDMLDEETWLSADRAIEFGFADEIVEPVRAAALARFNLHDYYNHVPEDIDRLKQAERSWRDEQKRVLRRMKST